MNRFTIIPSEIQFPEAPTVDQSIQISLEEKSQQITEYERSSTISLEEVFDNERQASTIFRPTFKISYVYSNTITGTTTYLPFQYNLYLVDAVESVSTGIWRGFPQYYEFDFFRPNISDQHVDYFAKSAYTYNWSYYISYASQNDENKVLNTELCAINTWVAKDGIPFTISNTTVNGSPVIQFSCVSPHGLLVGEYAKISFSYGIQDTFEVFSLGNGLTDSDEYIFNVFNYGYTGTTFATGKVGTFKRIINNENPTETLSKYYVRQHRILTDPDDLIMTKTGFEKNVFPEEQRLELSSLTPNNITRISKKTSSNAYSVTSSYDLDLLDLVDNQKRPVSVLYLTIIHKGYSGYFYDPSRAVGIKQGWQFNITPTSNNWWVQNNPASDSQIGLNTYTKTQSGQIFTFAFSKSLKKGDIIDGDFCEWNDYEQTERVISSYYQKILFNQNNFSTLPSDFGYYYKPHNPMIVRTFSDYIETADLGEIDVVPSYSYFSNVDQQFRWRDIYTYGFIDELGQGVDYPFLNSSHYPFENIVFRLIPEGANYNQTLQGINFPIKPLVDECE